MTLKNKLTAEFFGTFWLVFGGCGSAVLAVMHLTTDDHLLWLFWIAPFIGAALAAIVYPIMAGRPAAEMR